MPGSRPNFPQTWQLIPGEDRPAAAIPLLLPGESHCTHGWRHENHFTADRGQTCVLWPSGCHVAFKPASKQSMHARQVSSNRCLRSQRNASLQPPKKITSVCDDCQKQWGSKLNVFILHSFRIKYKYLHYQVYFKKKCEKEWNVRKRIKAKQ